MLLNGRVAESSSQGPAPLSIGFSVLLHACVLSLLAGARPLHMPQLQSAYQQTIQGREHKLVWYHFKEKLPEIKRLQSRTDPRPLRAEVKIRNQSIVSAPKQAPKAPQMIWQKAPEINTDIKFDSPNLVAVRLPRVDPPKRFVPPVPQAKKVISPRIEAPSPPQIDAARTAEVATRVALKEVARPLRDFKPPPSRIRAGLPQAAYVEPSPSLAASAADPRNPELAEVRLGKVYRPFEAPPPKAGKKAGKPGVAVPVLPSAPPPEDAGNSPDLNIVVVGLNPGSQLPALPPVSKPATFSAGPKLNPKGGTGEGNSAAALTVPDLTVKSGNIDTRSTIMARNSIPKSMLPNAGDALRDAAKYITVDEVGRPSAMRVSSAPYAGFDGRTVYMMAIQMPNITSYIGSWLLWYSEHNARLSATAVTPPVVHRKVDPKYVAEAVSERVEGTVRLTAVIRKDGTVGSVELVHGLDARLDRTAEEALAKWQFAPAMRNGEPVDVDILVEIPFRLKPRLE